MKFGLMLMNELNERDFYRMHRRELRDFEENFPDEESCKKRLFEWQWPEGYRCRECDHQEYYYHSSRELYECKQCRDQASLTAGTLFDSSRTPLKVWFYMIYVLCLNHRQIPLAGLKGYRAQIMGKGDHHRTVIRMVKKIKKKLSETDDYCVLVKCYDEDE